MALPLVWGNPVSYLDQLGEVSRPLLTHPELVAAPLGQQLGLLLGLAIVGFGMQADLDEFGSSASDDTVEDGPATQDSTPERTGGGTVEDEKEGQQAPGGEEMEDSGTPRVGEDYGLGLIYARVSSQQQADEGNSLDDQVSRLRELAAEREISLLREPIRDSAETGSDFDRPGIKQVAELAREGAFSYLLVDDIDRIGRHAPESLYYIYQLRQCGVTVITTQDGELDVEDITGLAVTFVKTFSSQLENETRTRRVKEARIEQFKQKNWLSAFKKVPFGYTERPDGWIEIDDEEAKVFRRAVKLFLETDVEGAYQRTIDAVGLENYDINNRRLKALLQRPVYIGEPTYRRQSDAVIDGLEDTVTVEDEDLQILTEERFERIQEKIGAVHDRYSTGSSGTADVETLVDRFGIEAVQHVCDLVQLRCPSPNCSGELVKNGTRTTDDETVHNYVCTVCDRQRKFPHLRELDGMRGFDGDD